MQLFFSSTNIRNITKYAIGILPTKPNNVTFIRAITYKYENYLVVHLSTN